MKITDLFTEADLLEKAAETIQELQSKLELAQAELSLSKQAQLDPVISSLRTKGFTEEEATNMANHVPSQTLQKVAKFTDSSVNMFEMGSPSSRVAKGGDPMLDFLMN